MNCNCDTHTQPIHEYTGCQSLAGYRIKHTHEHTHRTISVPPIYVTAQLWDKNPEYKNKYPEETSDTGRTFKLHAESPSCLT